MRESTRQWLGRAVFYEIYPASFFDANGDGIGDLEGIGQKLDYLTELGVNALLLGVCYASPFRNGGFDIVDHSALAPRYGGLDDMQALIAAAHARELKLCLDLVPGFTSDRHPWFQASATAAHGELDDRYVWADAVDGSAAGTPWGWARGAGERDAAYAYHEVLHQPVLNYRSDATCRALREIMAYWLGLGIDGFRVLEPEALLAGDPLGIETRRLWAEIRGWLEAQYPGRMLLATWGHPELASDAGFDLDFLINPAMPGYDALFLGPTTVPARSRPGYFQSRDPTDLARFVDNFAFQQARLRSDAFIGLPTSGVRLQRLNAGRSAAELEVIFTLLLTWPAVPCLYYGDEIGMRYLPDIESREGGHALTGVRTPMQWDGSALAGFSAHVEAVSWLPLDAAPDRPDVAAQRAAPDSLWHHVERLIYLRNTEIDLAADAGLEIIAWPDRATPLVFRRGQSLIVAVNAHAARAQADIGQFGDVTPVLQHRCQLTHDGAAATWRLRLGSQGYAVFSVR